MSPSVPTDQDAGAVPPTPAIPSSLDAIVSALATHGVECETVGAYLKRSLVTLASGLRGVCASLEARESASVVRSAWFADDARPEFWERTLESLLSDATIVRAGEHALDDELELVDQVEDDLFDDEESAASADEDLEDDFGFGEDPFGDDED